MLHPVTGVDVDLVCTVLQAEPRNVPTGSQTAYYTASMR